MAQSAVLLSLQRWRQQRPTHPIIADLRQRRRSSGCSPRRPGVEYSDCTCHQRQVVGLR